MALAATMQITDQDINTESSTKGGALIGQVAGTPDGRTFAYSRSAGALTRGQITEPVAVTANYANRTMTGYTAAVGAEQVSVVLGTTATADAFVGFQLVVNDSTGEGQGTYYIVGNTAATAGNSNTTTLYLLDGIRVALTAISDVTIMPSWQSSVIQHTAVVAFPTAGVPVISVTSGYYFWNQIGGSASVLSDGAITKNAEAIPSDATAGSVEIRVDATVVRAVGYAQELTVTTEYSPLMLTLG